MSRKLLLTVTIFYSAPVFLLIFSHMSFSCFFCCSILLLRSPWELTMTMFGIFFLRIYIRHLFFGLGVISGCPRMFLLVIHLQPKLLQGGKSNLFMMSPTYPEASWGYILRASLWFLIWLDFFSLMAIWPKTFIYSFSISIFLFQVRRIVSAFSLLFLSYPLCFHFPFPFPDLTLENIIFLCSQNMTPGRLPSRCTHTLTFSFEKQKGRKNTKKLNAMRCLLVYITSSLPSSFHCIDASDWTQLETWSRCLCAVVATRQWLRSKLMA